jgi:hypothetical protein
MPDGRFAYGSTYTFRVTPVNSCGESIATQPTISYQIKSSIPTGMNTPVLELASGNIISLSWTQPSDIVMGYREVLRYQLYYCNSASCSWSLLLD